MRPAVACKIGIRNVKPRLVHRNVGEHRVRTIHLVKVAKHRAHLAARTKRKAEKIFRPALLRADINVRAGVVGKGPSLIHLAHRDVLHGRRRENVQRYQFVVRIRRRDGQAVERRGAVTVAQPAHDELPCFGNGDARELLHSFLHVRKSLDGHFARTEVFNRKCGGLAFGQQRAFQLQVLACRDGHLVQLFVVGRHFHFHRHIAFRRHVQRDFLWEERHVGHLYRIGALLQVTQAELAVDVGRSAQPCTGNTDGGTHQGFVHLLVYHRTGNVARMGGHHSGG